MILRFALHCCLEKSSQIKKFKTWLMQVKHVDNILRNERPDFQTITKASRDASRRNNALTEPSHWANINTAASNNNNHNVLPKLLDSKCQLLYDNDRCLKCHHMFVMHHSKECLNEFPKPPCIETSLNNSSTLSNNVSRKSHSLPLCPKTTRARWTLHPLHF